MAETTVDMVISDLPNGELRIEHRMGSRTVSYADLTPEQAITWGETLLSAGLSRRAPQAGGASGAAGGASGAVVFTAGYGRSGVGRGIGGGGSGGR